MKPGIFLTFFAFLVLVVAPAHSQTNWANLPGGGTANTGHDFTFHSSTSSNTHSGSSRQTNSGNSGGSSSPSQPVAQQEDFDAEFQTLYLAADSKQAMQEWWDFAKRSAIPAAWFNYAAMASRLDDYDTAYKTYDWLTTHCGTDTRICEKSKDRAKKASEAMVAALHANLATSNCIMGNTYRSQFIEAQQEQNRLWAQKHDLDLKLEALKQEEEQVRQKTAAYNKQKGEWEMDPSSAGRANLQKRWDELVALQTSVTDGTRKWAVDTTSLVKQIDQNYMTLNKDAGQINQFSIGGACGQ